MKRSYLVQRLDPPAPKTILGVDNPFAFGGGLRNGGLTSKAMDLLRGIFSFDYMGAAEYEFGAVPEALQGLARDADDIIAFSFEIDLAKVKTYRKEKPPPGMKQIYVLCRAAHREAVIERIGEFAAENHRVKCGVLLSDVLIPPPLYTPRTRGWLELDNGFFFFTDEAMWRSTAQLFDVTTTN